MTQEEVNKTFEELKKEGMSEEDLVVALGKMYKAGDLTKDQLGALLYELGYEFTPEFDEKPEEEAKESMFSESDEPEEEPEEEGEEPESEEDESEEDEDEDDERKKAMDLFGRR